MATEAELYALMRQLDRLEELREDLLEIALRGGVSGDEIEDDIDEQAVLAEMAALGVKSLDEVERRMTALNAQLDEHE